MSAALPFRAVSHSWRSYVTTVAAIVLICSTSVQAEPLPANTTARIDDILKAALERGPIPGISIAIERRGEVVYQKGFGYADLENKVPVTPETVFPIGSITKTMTGLAIAQLTAQGKVDIDAPVGRYLPTLAINLRDIPIRNLLDHTSGIVNYTELADFPRGRQDALTREEVVKYFSSQPLVFKTGTRWSYTNSGQYLLGLVIETVSGKTYADYLQEYVFRPFGMSHASLHGWQTLIEHRAHGYSSGPKGFANAPRYDPLKAFAAGAILATSADLLAYRKGVFSPAPEATKLRDALLKCDSLVDGTRLPYSLGSLVLTQFEGHRRIGHPGDIYGFAAQYSYYPDDELTVVILTNVQEAAFPPVAMEQKIVREILALPQPVIRDVPLPAKLSSSVTGEYAVTHFRFGFDRVAFEEKNGVLSLVYGGHGGDAIPLRYQGGRRFVSSIDDEQWVEFQNSSPARSVDVALYGWPLNLVRAGE